MSLNLPPILESFVSASNRHDLESFAACMAPDAVVHDEGRELHGTEAIRAWFQDVSRKYSATMSVTDVTTEADETIITASVAGNFEGSPIDLRYHFTIVADKIGTLRIAP